MASRPQQVRHLRTRRRHPQVAGEAEGTHSAVGGGAITSEEVAEADVMRATQPADVAAEMAAGQDVVEAPSDLDSGRALWTYKQARMERDEEAEVADATTEEALQMQRCVCVGRVKHRSRRTDVDLRLCSANAQIMEAAEDSTSLR